ncbi:AT-hook motif nuclear-localized protein 1 [Spatholobus suberectus]|nr:AT-hook motif nuclear-localized protein 1 [Spatholobus suberectus]
MQFSKKWVFGVNKQISFKREMSQESKVNGSARLPKLHLKKKERVLSPSSQTARLDKDWRKIFFFIKLLKMDIKRRFDIFSLSGSFMPTENGVTRSRSGGMSVSLASPDRRVIGGGHTGLLVAAGPVQKQRVEHISTITSRPVNLINNEEIKVSFGGVKPIMTPAAFQEENIASFNNGQDSKNSSADDKDTLPEMESNARCEIKLDMHIPQRKFHSNVLLLQSIPLGK